MTSTPQRIPTGPMMDTTAGTIGGGARVLVVGASFAGLSTAYWMDRIGYTVTVIEVAKGLKKGGSPVDVREGTVDIVRRMGLLDEIRALSLPPKRTEFRNAQDQVVATMEGQHALPQAEDYEIERDVLLELLSGKIKGRVECIFGDSIAAIEQSCDDVEVTFSGGNRGRFELVFGCDGSHSSLRKMIFGPEKEFALFLQNYFAIAIVDTLLIPQDTTQIYNVPSKTMMLNAYNGKTDVCFCFYSEKEFDYDYRDAEQQRRIIREHFETEGWRAPEMIAEALRSPNFYFDKFSQIRMSSWSKGRVALVGDAAYCATPAAGMGGSLAIVGAAALADAFMEHEGRHEDAFRDYDARLRPFIDEVQKQAIDFGLEMIAPRTQEAIDQRSAQFAAG
ncbi:FAD-dependent monooxygenase [Xanthomonas nasturtii]|nr:FAD-dependent monooxygenase [Xanthomonas nasturtii]